MASQSSLALCVPRGEGRNERWRRGLEKDEKSLFMIHFWNASASSSEQHFSLFSSFLSFLAVGSWKILLSSFFSERQLITIMANAGHEWKKTVPPRTLSSLTRLTMLTGCKSATTPTRRRQPLPPEWRAEKKNPGGLRSFTRRARRRFFLLTKLLFTSRCEKIEVWIFPTSLPFSRMARCAHAALSTPLSPATSRSPIFSSYHPCSHIVWLWILHLVCFAFRDFAFSSHRWQLLDASPKWRRLFIYLALHIEGWIDLKAIVEIKVPS